LAFVDLKMIQNNSDPPWPITCANVHINFALKREMELFSKSY
jgi:hypothetical protein